MFNTTAFLTFLRRALPAAALAIVAASHLPVAADAMLDPELNESLLIIPPKEAGQSSIQGTLFLPDGPGPFPLLVINHGRELGPTRHQLRWRPTDVVRHWQMRGWAVFAPMREGYAGSGGPDDDVACPDIAARARAAGAQLHRAIDGLAGRSDIDLARIVVLGHSEGALTALGYAAGRPHAGLKGVINLAGGLSSGLKWCPWQDMLVHGVGSLASGASDATAAPMLWLYAANDRLFDHALARRMAQAWAEGGARAQLVLLPAVGDEGHEQILREPAQSVLWSFFSDWMQTQGLPVKVVQPRFGNTAEIRPIATGYARVDSVRDVPHLNDSGREVYRSFLRRSHPRALAISEDGAIGWANDLYKTQRAALRFCNRSAAPGRPCRLYAVDDAVVWSESAPAAAVSP